MLTYALLTNIDADVRTPYHATGVQVFTDMKFRGRDQVIIISGESGAGRCKGEAVVGVGAGA